MALIVFIMGYYTIILFQYKNPNIYVPDPFTLNIDNTQVHND